MTSSGVPMRRTVLYESHRRAGARCVEFAGWEMPLSYAGVVEEHRAAREAAGLFDVSHMGRFEVAGPDALTVVQRLTTNDAGRLTPGACQYSVVCNAAGCALDDIVVSCMEPEVFLLCVNAGNRDKILRHLRAVAGSAQASVTDRSDALAQLALQGPMAREILLAVAGEPDAVRALRPWHLATVVLAGRSVLISRTGYTGENGYELYPVAEAAAALWSRLLEAGQAVGLKPCGLGARDTLRLEMGYALYGHELDEATTPLEAGLDRFVRLDKGDFTGRDALLRQVAHGLPRRLVGFAMSREGIPRSGYPLVVEGKPLGAVTSGNFSPTLRKGIGLGYLPAREATRRPSLAVEIRTRALPAVITDPPFYRRAGTRPG